MAGRAIGILYGSGYTDDAIAHRGLLDAGVVLLPKPLSPEELLLRVQEALHSTTPPAPPATS